MIRINICDDSKQDVEVLKRELEKFELKRHIDFEVITFVKPELLSYELLDNKLADIYILDVSMPGMNGFELAEEIRKYTDTAVIIFLTSVESMATMGYKSRALRYILKMNIERELEEALDSALYQVEKNDEKTIIIRRYSEYWRVSYSDIICVSRISRQLVIATDSQGELTDNRGITEFYNAIDDNRFLFIDRGCFVNVDYISQLSGYELKMKNGKVLQISRRCLHDVKKFLLEYWGL
ncbi:MAG: response regulator transcription factor [Clostridia bacterium]|nr:response regulator transcription factor [Clostridia bacterium]